MIVELCWVTTLLPSFHGSLAHYHPMCSEQPAILEVILNDHIGNCIENKLKKISSVSWWCQHNSGHMNTNLLCLCSWPLLHQFYLERFDWYVATSIYIDVIFFSLFSMQLPMWSLRITSRIVGCSEHWGW
jgi:hypothetical protein